MRIGKFNSASIVNGLRIIKAFIRTRRDVQTNFQCSPQGDDSQPIEGADLVHSQTANDETTVIIGVIQPNQKSGPGEKRIFATDESGVLQLEIWLRNDGTIEIGGTGDFLPRFNELKTGFDQLTEDHNDLVGRVNDITDLLKTWTVAPTDGGLALQAQALVNFLEDVEDSTATIDNAKIDNLKTSSHG